MAENKPKPPRTIIVTGERKNESDKVKGEDLPDATIVNEPKKAAPKKEEGDK